jgi:hypothetical protein
MNTKQITHLFYKFLDKKGVYVCTEATIPLMVNGVERKQRVDIMSYDYKNIWRCYEIKMSKIDFKSKASHSFHGNYNYYVIPNKLYDAIKNDVPKGIGVYTVDLDNNGVIELLIESDYRRMNIKLENMQYYFIYSLAREVSKYMEIKDRFLNDNGSYYPFVSYGNCKDCEKDK